MQRRSCQRCRYPSEDKGDVPVLQLPEEEALSDIQGRARWKRRCDAGVGLNHRLNFVGEGPEGHIWGVRGEKATAIPLGYVWEDTPYKKDDPDLGGIVEVRLRREHWQELFINPEEVIHPDKSYRPYFLVTKDDKDPRYWIRGWAIGVEAARYGVYKSLPVKPGKKKNPPSYFMAPCQLYKVSEYQEILRISRDPSFIANYVMQRHFLNDQAAASP